MTARAAVAEGIHTRPGVKLVHKFRSQVLSMIVVNDRLIVCTERGVYRANKEMTRWRKMKL